MIAWLLPMVPGSAIAETNVQCMARTVYFEARGDGVEGMEAVAAVVMNRVAHGEFPDTVCGVVRQGGEQPPCQFSFWCDGRSDRPGNKALWSIALEVAERAVDGELEYSVSGALFFHTKAAGSPFGARREHVATVGEHLFYR